MTVQPVSGNEVASPAEEDDYGNAGLEDVDASDLMLPRLVIDHKKMLFRNSVTKEEFPALTIITLGLIKQRIKWYEKLEEDSLPQCKSPDNIHGFPNVRDNISWKYKFPWDDSNYTPDQLKIVELAPGESRQHPEGWSSNGHGVLACDTCSFAKWGKDKDQKNVPP